MYQRSISSLQCYSVLSTIAQVLRKMNLKILVSCFMMPHLSHTFESYQMVKIYAYSVNDLGLNFFSQLYGIYGHFYSLQIEHYAVKWPRLFSAIVFYVFLQLNIPFIESIRILF